ncbi:MAG: hypothetical protein QM594_22690 [Niabella sp.]
MVLIKRKRWLLIFLAVIAIAGYLILFYKTYNEKTVVHNADHIISVDVKKLTNTIIAQYITTPSQWKGILRPFRKKKEADWKDWVKLPDYIFIFHVAGQPLNAWYTVLEIKDNINFEKNISTLHFRNIAGTSRFISDSLGLEFIKHSSAILLGNASVENKTLITNTAADLFKNKNYISREKLHNNIATAAHVSWSFSGDSVIREGKGAININKNRISSLVTLTCKDKTTFEQKKIPVTDSALFNLNIITGSAFFDKLIPKVAKDRISRLVNFNIDSLFQPGISSWQAQINGFVQKADTAISYSYDADFNPIEQQIINNITEPDFSTTISGKNVDAIYRYWKDSGILQSTDQSELFTSMPLVRSYAALKAGAQLTIQSPGFKAPVSSQSSNACIMHLSVNLQRLPDSLQKYFPQQIIPVARKLASVRLLADSKTAGSITVQTTLVKKKDSFWFD